MRRRLLLYSPTVLSYIILLRIAVYPRLIFLGRSKGLVATRSSNRRRPPFVLRTFPPPGGITLDGSKGPPDLYSLPTRTLRYPPLRVNFYLIKIYGMMG